MPVEPGAVIGQAACPDCGSIVAVKVNKNRCVYISCRAVVDAATGERCYYRRAYGRVKSRQLIAEYEANVGTEDHVEPPEPERRPEPEPGRTAGSGDGRLWWEF